MPIGDHTSHQLIITMRSEVDLKNGDPVAFAGNMSVNKELGPLFGKALKATKAGETCPVAVRGVFTFDKIQIETGDKIMCNDGKIIVSFTGSGKYLGMGYVLL